MRDYGRIRYDDGSGTSGMCEVHDRTDEGADSGYRRYRFELYQDGDRYVKRSGGIWSGWASACDSVL